MGNETNREIQSNWRFELKYRISVFEYYMIRNALAVHMTRDYYTRIAPSSGYLVRSLYYDSYDYRAYHQKMNGDHERVKFRIRSYVSTCQEDTQVRVEMKVRKGNAMEKHSVMVDAKEYNHFLSTMHWLNKENVILQEFERHIHLWSLKPQVLVQYHREGYEDRRKDGIRVTFDHQMYSAHTTTLFPETPVFFRRIHPHMVVLEIKCQNHHPVWLRDLIRNYGLRWVANSKFAHSIQTARQDLYHPDGVVVVR